jgi:hypothetical protein
VKHAAIETPLRCLTHAAIETPQRSEAMVVVAEGQSLISVKTSDKQNCLSHLLAEGQSSKHLTSRTACHIFSQSCAVLSSRWPAP